MGAMAGACRSSQSSLFKGEKINLLPEMDGSLDLWCKYVNTPRFPVISLPPSLSLPKPHVSKQRLRGDRELQGAGMARAV